MRRALRSRSGFTRTVQTSWKALAAAALLVVVGAAGAQGSPGDGTVSSVPPDVFVQIKPYPTGTEMVTVTVRKEGYPADLLRAQCQAVGTEAGSPIRGLQVMATDLQTTQQVALARASFGADGLIDAATGALNLQAVVRAFAGAPEEWQIRGMMVTFDGVSPTGRTLSSLNTESVKVASQLLPDPLGIEYRIVLDSQVPTDVVIPSLVEAEAKADTPKTGSTGPNPLLFVVLAIGALSGGALVYFAALRPSPRK